jgi:hypothetical protein
MTNETDLHRNPELTEAFTLFDKGLHPNPQPRTHTFTNLLNPPTRQNSYLVLQMVMA